MTLQVEPRVEDRLGCDPSNFAPLLNRQTTPRHNEENSASQRSWAIGNACHHMGGLWLLQEVVTAVSSMVPSYDACFRDFLRASDEAESVVLSVSPAVNGVLSVASANVSTVGSAGLGIIRSVGHRAYSLWPILDRQVSFPIGERPHLGTGRLLDDEHYEQPFCITCSGALIEALCSFEPSVPQHTCACWIPKRCQACDPEFFPRGLREEDLEERRLYCPSEACVTFKAMGHTKQAHPKKNFSLAWTAYCEGRSVDVRKEALMDFMVRITQLHSHPARVFPRWAALPLLRCLDWSYPMKLGSRFATSWQPVGKAEVAVVVASHPLVMQAAENAENDNCLLEIERVPDRELREEMGLPEPPLLPSNDTSGRGPDGRNRKVEGKNISQVAPPTSADTTVYSNHSHANAMTGVLERIGGKHAEKRKFRWAPSEEAKQEAKAILKILKIQVFTKKAVMDACRHLGPIEDAVSGRMSEEESRNLVNEMLAGYQLKEETPTMVKREAMPNDAKTVRLVMNMGINSFITGAYVHKVIEHILSHFDAAVNIKHRAKADLMDELTTQCCEGYVYNDETGLNPGAFPSHTARFVESDYSMFEYSQAWEFVTHEAGVQKGWRINGMEQHEQDGMLGWERDLIHHVEGLIPVCYNELHAQFAKNTPSKAKTTFVPCVRDQLFKKFNWRFTLFLLCRKSGDLQTSYGNRLHNLMAMSISTLKRGRDLFYRLVEFMHQRKDPDHPRNWIFVFADGTKQYWKLKAEGDDFASQNIGNMECDAIGSCSLDVLPTHSKVLAGLNALGLDSKYFVRHTGRLEFVGVHCLIESGFTVPGAWAPAVKRGLAKSSYGMTEAFKGRTHTDRLQIALSFVSRAAMFGGRIDPLANYYMSMALGHASEDELHAATHISRPLNWEDALLIGERFGTSVSFAKLYDLFVKLEAPRPLESRLQRRLCELSVEGEIDDAEWGRWVGAPYGVDSCPLDNIVMFPASVRP